MNDTWKRMLKNAPAYSFRGIFTKLAQLHQQKDDALPTVSVYLRNGSQFSGTVVAFEQLPQQEVVVLHVVYAQDRYSQRNAVVYLQLSDVAAVSFDNADESPLALEIVSGGKNTPYATLEPVSKLQFQRYLKEQSESLSYIHQNFIVEADAPLLNTVSDFAGFRLYTEKLVQIVRELSQDAMGKEALQTKVQKIVLATDSRLSAQLDGQTLWIRLNPTELTNQTLSTTDLKNAIESAL